MNKFWKWLVASSADSTQTALTVRGFLLGVIPVLSIVLGLAHIKVGQQELSNFVDGVIAFLQAVLSVVAAGMFVYGLARKLWSTWNGTNAVLNSPEPPPQP